MRLTDLRGRRVLVTGAGGFFGSHLVPALARAGARVHALMRSRPADEGADDIDVHVADLTDAAAVAQVVRASDPSCVFHLAAYGTTARQPDASQMFAVNVTGTRNLWSALGDRPCRLVHTGSCGEYGDAAGAIRESIACRPQSSYPATVHAAVTVSIAGAYETGREVVIVRPFGPYGPGDRPERIIPFVITTLLAGGSPQVTAGEQRRDYSYIDDQVRALLLAATAPLQRVAPIFNIGSGRPILVRELITAIADAVGGDALSRVAFGAKPYRRDDPPEMYADVSLAASELGYVATTPLADGLCRTVATYRSRATQRG